MSPIHPRGRRSPGGGDRRSRVAATRSTACTSTTCAIPTADFDYSRAALLAFRRHLDPDDDARRARCGSACRRADGAAWRLTDTVPERWAEFRRSRLTTLVMRRAHGRQDAGGRTRSLSAAVYPDAAEAATHRLQDWRDVARQSADSTWSARWPTRRTPTTFARRSRRCARSPADAPVWAGIGAYRLSPAQTVDNIVTARRLGASGIVLFSYDSLVHPPRGLDYLTTVGRAAFTP